MADTTPDLEKIANALLSHPFTDFGVILGVGGGRRGYGVVKRNDNTIRVQNSRRANLFKDAADGGGVIMAEDDIRFNVQYVSGAGFADACGAR
jgi:hypothetical protein